MSAHAALETRLLICPGTGTGQARMLVATPRVQALLRALWVKPCRQLSPGQVLIISTGSAGKGRPSDPVAGDAGGGSCAVAMSQTLNVKSASLLRRLPMLWAHPPVEAAYGSLRAPTCRGLRVTIGVIIPLSSELLCMKNYDSYPLQRSSWLDSQVAPARCMRRTALYLR